MNVPLPLADVLALLEQRSSADIESPWVARSEVMAGSQRVLYLCRPCGHHWAQDWALVAWWEWGANPGTGYFAQRHAEVLRDPHTGAAPPAWPEPPALCPQCNQPVREAVWVKGEFRPDIACGERCREATGSLCRCLCGGAHHGEAWLKVGTPDKEG